MTTTMNDAMNESINDTMNDLLGLHPAAKGTLLRDHLSAVSGFRWESVEAAQVALDDHRSALISFDAAGDLRFTVSLDDLIDPVSVLERNHQLPSNLRFALDGGRFQLVADIRSSHPAELLETIVNGARLALAGQTPGQAPQQHDAELDDAEQHDAELEERDVGELLHSLPQHDDSLVDLEEGWEYRPRVNGQPIAVKVRIHGLQLRCQRAVRQLQGNAEIRTAAAVEALRINARIKHARVAAIDSRLVAETCIHRCQFDKEPLLIAMRAVAVTEHQAHAALVILTNEEHIAAQYSRVFDCGV